MEGRGAHYAMSSAWIPKPREDHELRGPEFVIRDEAGGVPWWRGGVMDGAWHGARWPWARSCGFETAFGRWSPNFTASFEPELRRHDEEIDD